MIFSKVVKLLPLVFRDPTNILFVPVSIFFGQLHALIKLYAGSTLHVVSLPRIPGLSFYKHFRAYNLFLSIRPRGAVVKEQMRMIHIA